MSREVLAAVIGATGAVAAVMGTAGAVAAGPSSTWNAGSIAAVAAGPTSGVPSESMQPPQANTTTAIDDHSSLKVAVPEPSGYWTGPTNSPVPTTLAGGKVIASAHRLHALLSHKDTVLIDVSSAPRRPENMAPGAPWLPVPHRAIPGTVWLPGAGGGEIPAPVESFFRQQLATTTGNDPTRRVVFYCHKACWLSWNAAKRAISYGYQHVYWYRDGIEGWKAAGLPTEIIEPRAAPGN